jgi:hypothetical protein
MIGTSRVLLIGYQQKSRSFEQSGRDGVRTLRIVDNDWLSGTHEHRSLIIWLWVAALARELTRPAT